MKKKIEIFLIGSGGHAASCIDLIESTRKYKILGIFTDEVLKSKIGYRILGNTSEISKFKKTCKNVVLGFGAIYDLKKGIKFIIHY